MDNLNRFCNFNKLPADMARQLREYYYETKQIQAAAARSEICAGALLAHQRYPAWVACSRSALLELPRCLLSYP